MKWIITLLTITWSTLFNAGFGQQIIPPPNPAAPAPNGTNLPIVIVNNSGLDDSQVFISGIGQTPDQTTNVGYSAFVIDTNTGLMSLQYFQNGNTAPSYPLSSLPTTTSGRVVYAPNIISGVFYFSLLNGITLTNLQPDGTSFYPAGSYSGPSFTDSSATSPTSSYNTVFDTFEFTFQSVQPQLTANATAVNFFGIPLYAFLSTPVSGTAANVGLYQPRDYILGYAKSVLGAAPSPENQQWLKLLLPSSASNPNFSTVRLLNPSLAMVPPVIMDTQYLDNAADYGFSFLGDIWTNSDSFYRANSLRMQIPTGSQPTYNGTIKNDNTIHFTEEGGSNLVVFSPPHKAIYTSKINKNSTTEEIFAGNTPILYDSSTTGDGVQLAKLFAEAIMGGVLPNPILLSDSSVNAIFNYSYKNSLFLPQSGSNTGPWFNKYSQALHALSTIYTFAYDDSNALWGSTCTVSSTNFETSPLTYLGITIGQCTTSNVATIALATSSNPVIEGHSLTFTATVTGNNASSAPTGTVQFNIDGTDVGGAQPLPANGVVTYSTSSLTPGVHTVLAIYSGDAIYPQIQSSPISEYIIPAQQVPTVTTIKSSLNPAQLGQKVVFFTSVQGVLGFYTPSGTVTFTIDDVPSSPIALGASGRAIFETSSLSVGSHTVSVTYSGDAFFQHSNSPTIFQVIVDNTQGPTTTTLTSSANPSNPGEAVTFLAHVQGAFGDVQGKAVFLIDGVKQVASVVNGIASITVSNLSVGSHEVVVRYRGDTNNLPSVSNILTQVVSQNTNKGETQTALTTSVNPSSSGQLVTFTVLVTGINGIPTGTVIISVDGAPFSTLTLDKKGFATLSTTSLTDGVHTVVAQYQGDSLNNPSTSNEITQVVGSINLPPSPPTDLHVHQVKNRFATQTDLINVLTWKAPQSGTQPVSYNIYRDAKLKNKIATVSVRDPSLDRIFNYEDHNRKKGRTYHYFIVSVGPKGAKSAPAEVTFHSRSGS